MKIKDAIRQILPPVLWNALRFVWKKGRPLKVQMKNIFCKKKSKDGQDLELYWDSKMAAILETWGEGNAWVEIKFMMVNCKGKVLDIACGTGKTIEILKAFPNLELYGCDISDFLIQKAIDRGISKDRLKVCDATKTGYASDAFDYSYSIGSLEHFTEEGIAQFISEAYRITKYGSCHMVPVSKSGKDEGWISPYQSYHNNSVEWWKENFMRVYKNVHIIDSKWEDDSSSGIWIVCLKEGE